MGWNYWIARPITERYANVRFGGKTSYRLLFCRSGQGLAGIPRNCLQTGHRCGKYLVSANPLTLNEICFDKALQVLEIPYLGNFFLVSKNLTLTDLCGKFLVLTNPLILNEICFDKAFPTKIIFIYQFLTGSLFFCRLIYLMDSFSGYPPLEELVVLKGP